MRNKYVGIVIETNLRLLFLLSIVHFYEGKPLEKRGVINSRYAINFIELMYFMGADSRELSTRMTERWMK